MSPGCTPATPSLCSSSGILLPALCPHSALPPACPVQRRERTPAAFPGEHPCVLAGARSHWLVFLHHFHGELGLGALGCPASPCAFLPGGVSVSFVRLCAGRSGSRRPPRAASGSPQCLCALGIPGSWAGPPAPKLHPGNLPSTSSSRPRPHTPPSAASPHSRCLRHLQTWVGCAGLRLPP